MELSPTTRLDDLLKEYPFLLDFLVNYRPEFQKLKNPLIRKIALRTASLETVASMGGMTIDQLISDLTEAIEKGRRESPQRLGRREALKAIIKELHEGKAPETLKARFASLLEDVSPGEIGSLEQELVGEGLSPEEITKLCDLHVQLFQEGLEKQAKLETGAQHPLTQLRVENRQLGEAVAQFRETLVALRTAQGDRNLALLRDKIGERLDELARVETHYQRKENQLFPFLEKRGITAPPQVMWSVHDEVRALLKDTKAALHSKESERLIDKGEKLAQKMEDMIVKEERILFPMAMEVLTNQDWQEMGRGYVERGASKLKEDLFSLNRGELSIEQLNLILTHVPIDITFVDQDDVVRYYSEGKERIFVRTPQVIGRKVQNCHPPNSVHIVNRILQEFRAGTRNVAEFWINHQGKLVHIRYFAVRDKNGGYRGTLEVTQDITKMKALEGEHRLLDWE